MPTPPPWWTLTQCAPAAVLSSALRIGQSAIASEPSLIASVSRYGRGDRAGSRWSRPITIGAVTSPLATSSLNAQPACGALAVAEPADPRRQALERDALLGHRDPALQPLVVGEQLERRRGRSPRCRPGRRRAPPSGTAPCPRRTAAGRTPARSPGSRTRGRSRPSRPARGGCCRSRTTTAPASLEREHRLARGRPSTRATALVVLRVALARAPRLLERRARPGT